MLPVVLRSSLATLSISCRSLSVKPTVTSSSAPAIHVQPRVRRAADSMSSAEWALRIDLAAAYRLAALHSWTDMLDTHISARIPDEQDAFLINPYGLLFDEITASSLLKVDEHCAVLDGGGSGSVSDGGYGVNPAGFNIHSAVHMARRDVVCVMHTHTAAGAAVASQCAGLLPLTQNALLVHDELAYHPFEGISMDRGERERIATDLGEKNLLFMRNHGLLSVRRSVAEAFVWMFRAERACQMQIAIQQAGAPCVEVPEEVQQLTFARNREANSATGFCPIGKLEWPALLRKLDRVDPSFRE